MNTVATIEDFKKFTQQERFLFLQNVELLPPGSEIRASYVQAADEADEAEWAAEIAPKPMSRMEFAAVLDRQAARAYSVNASPASRKQVWFLAGLMEQAGATDNDVNISNSSYVLTSREASRMIDFYLQTKRS